MKIKYQLAVICAALAMTNCSHEDEVSNSNQGSVRTLQAVIESGSRSAVTDGGAFSWATGDEISVWDGTGYQTYTYSGTDNIFLGSSNTISGYAVYPSGEHGDVTESTLPMVNLKKEYSYGSTNAIMLAEIQEGSDKLTFMHLGGLMRFVIKNIPAEAGSFTFTANIGITGDFQVETENDKKVIKSATGTEENKTVAIHYEAGDAGRTMTFYIPLPLGTYTGFTIALGEKKYETTAAINTIQRGTLLLMPTYKYDGSGLTKEDGHTIVLEDNENAEVAVSSGKVMIDATEASDATVTLKYTPENNTTATLSLSDGSAENASSSNESKATVNVTVPENATVSELNIDMPTMTVELNVGSGTATYQTVVAKTAAQTLIVRKGITINNLTIEGGNVIIEDGATVTTITNNADGNTIIRRVTTAEGLNTAMAAGGMVELGNDIIAEDGVSFNVPSNVEVTLDLKGHALSGSSSEEKSFSFITNNGTLNINDTGDGNGKISYNFTGTGDTSFGWGTYTIVNKGTMVINNGVIENVRENSAPHMYNAIDNYTGATLTMNGGVVKCENYIAIRLFATNEQTDNKVVINSNAKVIGKFSIWPQNTSNGKTNPKATLDINGGTIEGNLYLDSSDNFTLTADNANLVISTDDGLANAMEIVGEGCTIHMAEGEYSAIEFGPRSSDLEIGENYKYKRSIKGLTIKPVEKAEVTIAGLTTITGHIHSQGGTVDVIAPDGTNVNSTGYYSTLNLENITFEGLKFTNNVSFDFWYGIGTVNGIYFTNCLFDLGGTESGIGACIQFGAGGELHPTNVTITNCEFKNAYQGVLVNQAGNVTVTSSTFDTMGHNAIQTNGSNTASVIGTITITDNTFLNGSDRALRSDLIAASAKFVITRNTFSAYCDSDSQVMKSSNVTSGATYDISSNTYEGTDMETKNVSNVTEFIWSKPNN